jgi:two-component system, NtrC family, nitrogen regulation response regulator GlnG
MYTCPAMEDTEDLRHRLQTETRTSDSVRGPGESVLVPGLTVLFHPDVERIGEVAPLAGLLAGRDEALSRAAPAFASPGSRISHPLGDPFLSRRPVVFIPGPERGSIRLFCGGSGTRVAVDGEPVENERQISAAELDRGVVLLLAGRVVLLLSRIDPTAGMAEMADLPSYGMVGEGAAMVRLRQEIRRVSDLDVPVLLRGETGTGKELVARALHDSGPRRNRPFLAVNMGAVPPSLAASELFGAARGAFTGADQKRIGYFSRADGGTLFLDEIGETPAEVQVLLLRVLESREIRCSTA